MRAHGRWIVLALAAVMLCAGLARAQTERPAECALPAETGLCRASIERFAYNPASGTCEPFLWGGCEGNANNFQTAEACEAKCGVAAVAPPQDSQTPDVAEETAADPPGIFGPFDEPQPMEAIPTATLPMSEVTPGSIAPPLTGTPNSSDPRAAACPLAAMLLLAAALVVVGMA